MTLFIVALISDPGWSLGPIAIELSAAAGGQGQPVPAVSAVNKAREERCAFAVERNRSVGLQAFLSDALGLLVEFRRDNLQLWNNLGTGVTVFDDACVGNILNDALDRGIGKALSIGMGDILFIKPMA